MTDDELALFEAIWAGDHNGFSEQQLRAHLADHEASLKALHEKRITPRSVVGPGYKNGRKVAVEWLTRQIEQGRRDVASRGRTCSVNQSNVRYELHTRTTKAEEALTP